MNEGFNLVKIQGLAQTLHGPHSHDLSLFCGSQKTGDERYRDFAELAEILKDFIAFHSGHALVQKNKVVTILPDLSEPVFALRRDIDLIALLLQGLLELLTDRFFVIDD